MAPGLGLAIVKGFVEAKAEEASGSNRLQVTALRLSWSYRLPQEEAETGTEPRS